MQKKDNSHRGSFPDGFFWGSSTSSYQTEGGIENTDWAEAAREGKVPVCGKTTGHYHLYEKDFDIAKDLGQNAHRFSIEWARIEPEEGKFNIVEIEHYRQVIKALKSRGLEPFVTLWHFTLPLWFAKKGGFASAAAPETFSRYCEFVISALGSEAKYWITLNEPMVYAAECYQAGRWPPFRKNLFLYFIIQRNLAKTHQFVYKMIKKICPHAQVGVAKHQFHWISCGGIANKLKAMLLKWHWNERFLRKIEKSQDFIGVNYYRHWQFGKDKNIRKEEKTDMGWTINPEGILPVLLDLKKYDKPIFITENGLADVADSKRTSFISEHLRFVKKAIDAGVDVRGYFYWSLLDNYEWAQGFGSRFGLVKVDYKTLERKIRPSAFAYKEIAEKNVI